MKYNLLCLRTDEIFMRNIKNCQLGGKIFISVFRAVDIFLGKYRKNSQFRFELRFLNLETSLAASLHLSSSCRQSPDPGLRSEVRYQCRPDRFSSELTCSSGDNTRVRLECRGRGVVTILSTQYLAITGGPLHCPDTGHSPGGCDNITINYRMIQR